jgi:seryl-tRNA synthetase
MLDLQFVCDNIETIRTNCGHRHVEADLDQIVLLRDKRSQLITQADQTRHEQKETSALIPKAAPADKQALVEKGRALRERVAQLEAELTKVEADVRSGLMTMPIRRRCERRECHASSISNRSITSLWPKSTT